MSRYFEQLRQQAIDKDRVALPQLAKMLQRDDTDAMFNWRSYWRGMPIDKAMNIARKLIDCRHEFDMTLKKMLLEDRIRIHVGVGNSVVHVKDPAVIDFDEDVLTKTSFLDLFTKDI